MDGGYIRRLDAVIFQVYQQPGGNTVAINQAIKAKLKEFKKRMPKDLLIANPVPPKPTHYCIRWECQG